VKEGGWTEDGKKLGRENLNEKEGGLKMINNIRKQVRKKTAGK